MEMRLLECLPVSYLDSLLKDQIVEKVVSHLLIKR